MKNGYLRLFLQSEAFLPQECLTLTGFRTLRCMLFFLSHVRTCGTYGEMAASLLQYCTCFLILNLELHSYNRCHAKFPACRN